MTLTEALVLVFNDSLRCTRRAWANQSIFIELHRSQLCLKGYPDDGLWHPWTITENDWFADDWEVVE